MTVVNDITRNAFVDGLNEPFNLTVRGARPMSLEESKSAAEEQFQSVLRNQRYQGRSQAPSKPNSTQNNSQNPGFQRNQNRFSQARNSFQYKNFGENSRPNSSRNFSSPPHQSSPMEVDASSRSQSVQPVSNSYRTRNFQVANAENDCIPDSQQECEEEGVRSDENPLVLMT